MAISLSDHRVTAMLEDAVWELCFYGSAQIRSVPPHDVDTLKVQLLLWGEASDVQVLVGEHGDTLTVRLCV
jgi:hypothetical protein